LRSAALVGIVLLAAACGSSSSSSSPSSSKPAAAGATTTYPALVPVGPDPSVSSKMVCGTEGQAAIAAFTNETPTKVTTPKWQQNVYSCTYVYPNGTMGLAVKELATKAETDAYYASLQHQFGLKQKFELGQGAFVAPDGKVVTRKDYKVLTVDPTTLPASFGEPPTSRSNIAIGAASALMGCWTGA